jgi:hypothetical protein
LKTMKISVPMMSSKSLNAKKWCATSIKHRPAPASQILKAREGSRALLSFVVAKMRV